MVTVQGQAGLSPSDSETVTSYTVSAAAADLSYATTILRNSYLFSPLASLLDLSHSNLFLNLTDLYPPPSPAVAPIVQTLRLAPMGQGPFGERRHFSLGESETSISWEGEVARSDR